MSKQKFFIKWLLIPLSISLMLPAQITAAESFVDVKENNPNFVAINYLKEQGIIEGYNDGSYKPYQNISRAEALKMLILTNEKYNKEDIEGKTLEEDPFTDTSKEDWFSPYLAVAKENNIVKGYDDGSFMPQKTINLAESLKIYLESLENILYPNDKTLYIYADTPDEDWYSKYTAYAGSKGMIYINNDNRVFPNQEMTRGYLAEILYRKIMSDKGYVFGKATYYGKAVQGNSTASGETFDMNNYTAAHKTLPFNTIVEVTNLANGKSVEVKITDRGPYGPGRIIDLTSTAFEEICPLSRGVAQVQYKIISMP